MRARLQGILLLRQISARGLQVGTDTAQFAISRSSLLPRRLGLAACRLHFLFDAVLLRSAICQLLVQSGAAGTCRFERAFALNAPRLFQRQILLDLPLRRSGFGSGALGGFQFLLLARHPLLRRQTCAHFVFELPHRLVHFVALGIDGGFGLGKLARSRRLTHRHDRAVGRHGSGRVAATAARDGAARHCVGGGAADTATAGASTVCWRVFHCRTILPHLFQTGLHLRQRCAFAFEVLLYRSGLHQRIGECLPAHFNGAQACVEFGAGALQLQAGLLEFIVRACRLGLRCPGLLPGCRSLLLCCLRLLPRCCNLQL